MTEIISQFDLVIISYATPIIHLIYAHERTYSGWVTGGRWDGSSRADWGWSSVNKEKKIKQLYAKPNMSLLFWHWFPFLRFFFPINWTPTIPLYLYTHTHTRARARACAYIHICIQTCNIFILHYLCYTCVCVYVRAHARAHTHTHTYTHTHTHTHIYLYICTYTYIYAHMYIYIFFFLSFCCS